MFILKKGQQPGVYVPLRALFLVCDKVMRTAFPLILAKTIIKKKTRRSMKLAFLHTIQPQAEQFR